MSIFTQTFALAALERAVKTFAQAAAALLVADGTGLLAVDWGQTASVAGMAAVISLLTSVGSSAVTESPGPSLATETTAPEVDTADAGRHYDRDGDGLAGHSP